MLLLQKWMALLYCTQLHCMAPLNAALRELLHVFENRVIQLGDSVWEALKFFSSGLGKLCNMNHPGTLFSQ